MFERSSRCFYLLRDSELPKCSASMRSQKFVRNDLRTINYALVALLPHLADGRPEFEYDGL